MFRSQNKSIVTGSRKYYSQYQQVHFNLLHFRYIRRYRDFQPCHSNSGSSTRECHPLLYQPRLQPSRHGSHIKFHWYRFKIRPQSHLQEHMSEHANHLRVWVPTRCRTGQNGESRMDLKKGYQRNTKYSYAKKEWMSCGSPAGSWQLSSQQNASKFVESTCLGGRVRCPYIQTGWNAFSRLPR